jgi:hypothetical protein
MKKIFFSLVALAVIAACSKSEIAYEQTGEIGFVPVAKKATKVAEDDAVYNTKLDMYIFANTYTDADNTLFTQPYFANARFTHRKNGIFGGKNAVYYWPNVKTLKFAGLSASGNVNNGATPELTANLEIKLDGYAPGTGGAEEGDNDLMWFPITQAYGKSDVPGTGDTPATDDNIEVVMKHACAWVTINFKGNTITGTGPGTNAWEITDVYFNDLSLSGNVKLGTDAEWTSVANNATPTYIYQATTTTNGGKDERNGVPLTQTLVDYTDKIARVSEDFKFADLVVVPQSTKILYVAYEYLSDTQNQIKFSETKTIPLTFGTNGTAWEAGKHYIYDITITTTEILVEPSVKPWDTDLNNDGLSNDNIAKEF